MKPDMLIKDGDYANALDKMGFCVAPIFTPEQVAGIRSLYEQFSVEENVKGLIASHSKIGGERNIALSNALKEIVMPALQNSFWDFDFFMGGFMVKEARNMSELTLHQDWNILDESLYTSYQIWIPVDLSYPGNGGMFVLPGSHRFYTNFRSGSYGIPDVQTGDSLRPYTVDMIIPPGQALVFHNSLFHASYPNQSDQTRISAIISIYKRNAPLTYWQKNAAENRTDVYGINSEIFLTSLNKLENGGIPDQPLSVGTALLSEVNNKLITSENLLEKYKTWLGKGIESFEPRQRTILRDKSIQARMDRDGYAVLDFLDADAIVYLTAEYKARFNAVNTTIGRFTAMEHTTPAGRRSIHDLISDAFRNRLGDYFENYNVAIASYFTKYAHSRGDLDWHTDASLMINTHLEPHYGLWCPLMDVNEKNGAFSLIEGSHKYAHVLYVDGINWPFREFSADFDRLKTVLELKAGQMVLFDMRLIHNATANDTDVDRLTACARLTHDKTTYYSFLCEKRNEPAVSVYEERHDYYLRDEWSGKNQAADRSKKAGEIHDIYSNFDRQTIQDKLEALAISQVARV